MSLNPHPPSALVPSHSSPRTRSTGQGHSFSLRGSSSSSNGNGAVVLQASNSNGRDPTGYFVGSQRTISDFVDSFFSKPLGSININSETHKKDIQWVAGNWRSLSTTNKEHKVLAMQNTEAKKIMELFVHLATEEEIGHISAVSPLNPAALSVVLNKKSTAKDDVIVRLLHFLDGHEKLRRKTTSTSSRQATARVSTTGALYSRWKILNYTTTDTNDVDTAPNPIHPWANAGMALNGRAIATGSDSSGTSDNRKRSRKEK